MNNLSSYCGLVDAKIRASDKDLPVHPLHTVRKLKKWKVWKKCSKRLVRENMRKAGNPAYSRIPKEFQSYMVSPVYNDKMKKMIDFDAACSCVQPKNEYLVE